MSNADAKPGPRACPICAKPAKEDYLPFCSRRCADIDLHRWLADGYAIPAEDLSEDDAAAPGERDEREA